jgi:membrane protease YdiL (CAAX protease family)
MAVTMNPGEDKLLDPAGTAPVAAGTQSLWPLGLFFLLSAAFAWTAWWWPVNENRRLIIFILGWNIKIPFHLLKLLIGNCLPGVLAVIWVLFEGKAQFRQMLSTLTKWRTPIKWYILAFILPCSVSLVALDLVLYFFPTEHSFPPAITFFTNLLMTLPFGPLWEELAWRAFALRKLEARYSRLVSALLIGMYWAVWHIPLWLIQINRMAVNKAAFLLAGVVTLVAWSVIWTYLYHRSSESLPVVILLHTMYGAVTTQASLVAPRVDTYIVYVSAALAACLAASLLGVLRRSEMEEGEFRT